MDHKIDTAEPPSRLIDTRTDARVVKSRTALREALIALAGEKPFAELTVAEIAKRAGVGYATFFRHFPDKETLLADIAEGLILDLLVLMGPLLLESETRAASLELARFVDARRPICHALLVGAGDAMRREITARATRISIDRHVETTPGLPAEVLMVHSVGATLNILGWWLERAPGMEPEAMATILDRLVLTPVSTGQGGCV